MAVFLSDNFANESIYGSLTTNATMVFLTPHGNSDGPYTTAMRGGFSVHENNGGHSSLAFDYRLVAVPQDRSKG